jgi:hypothetical protein
MRIGARTHDRDTSAERDLQLFIDRYMPEIATLARACLKKMRTKLPGAVQLVYDNYNALVIGFGPSERASEAIFSIALYPRWVTLFFLQGAGLPDPNKLLKGSGKVVRHIVLADAADLDKPAIRALMTVALNRATAAIVPDAPGSLEIRSISAKQRSRRP